MVVDTDNAQSMLLAKGTSVHSHGSKPPREVDQDFNDDDDDDDARKPSREELVATRAAVKLSKRFAAILQKIRGTIDRNNLDVSIPEEVMDIKMFATKQ